MAEKYNTREERRKQGQTQKKAPKNGPKKSASMLKRIFLILVTIGIIGLVTGGAALAYFISDAPKLDEKLLKDPVTSKILDEDGKLLAEVGRENRDYVNYEDIPDLVKEAFLATEDSRFYKHHGVDFLRLGSAVIANVKNGFGSEGASTLTQQVIKRSYLTPDKTIKRKVQEMWLSIQLERKYTKDEIFEMYVNKIFFANRANGILTASQTYYGKDLSELKLNEAAMLVGLPQSPSRYDPYKYPERAKERRDIVLHLMNKHGYISEKEMKDAQNIDIAEGLQEVDKSQIDTTAYDAFIDLVIEEVGDMGDYNVFTDGLEIQTTIDKDAQEYVYKMLNSDEVINYPSKDLQAGLTLLDTQSGEIKAVGGGRNTTVKRGWNYATDAKRSPGSTIKPILDYGPAVEYLNWSTYHQIKDEEYTYSDGTPLKNASGRHYGTVTTRDALARSLNIPALKTLQAVGLDRARDFAVDLGIPFDKEITESAAIGGGKDVSTLELAGAYSSFGNSGIYNKPHTVKKIVLRDKTTIKNKMETKPVMKDSTAFIVTDMLKSVMKEPYGTGRLANIPNLPVAGKTGSTNFTPEQRAKNNIPSSGVKDSWMAGYTTNYTVAVWAGYDNAPGGKMEYLGDSSQRIPKAIFKNLMEYMANSKETKDFEQPDSVVKVGVIKGSNPAIKANEYTPSDKITYEYYVKGHEPTQVTTEYKKMDSPGINGSYNQESNEINLSWSYPKGNGKTQFEVKMSVDGGAQSVLKKSKDTSLTIPNPTPGSKYTFTVVALVDNQQSDPASTSVEIPAEAKEPEKTDEDIEKPAEDENLEQETPTEGEDNQGKENQGEDNGNGNTDNGNGNGNENGNGNNNGNTDNGNGNGNKDDEDVVDEGDTEPGTVEENKPEKPVETPDPTPDPDKPDKENKD
ncbi:PBP1A family penicillin-binding protein [Peribacillus butanolivorans]|uniref:PBP1A family penicillin-binding protein n=1 Tax=Peribacillus butanolivorans TaxID=421767 RepID=UPI00207D6A1D|nr:penicillin-binding protein 1A [Peribacillus butanolivorans]MCO0596616.1 PBP1A family penicillin-binding protein [Peribacillus butanolivorans]